MSRAKFTVYTVAAAALVVGVAVAARVSAAAEESARSFDGLDDPAAVTVLRREFGQGVSPSDGRILYDLIVKNKYKRGLDIGTARGYSACWLGLAMKRTGGHLVSLDIDSRMTQQARANLREAGLDAVVDARVADALVEIPKLPGDFDFVFMDTGEPLNKNFLDLLYNRISLGGMITAHNADGFKRGQPDFLNAIQNDPNLETHIIPTRLGIPFANGGISVTVKKRSGPAAK